MSNRRLATAATLIALCALTGCASTEMEEQRADILTNQTPGMATLNQRWEDNTNTISRVSNTNLHSALGDLNRFWLLDRPSRLTREPMR
jgi:hypothetical protein